MISVNSVSLWWDLYLRETLTTETQSTLRMHRKSRVTHFPDRLEKDARGKETENSACEQMMLHPSVVLSFTR